MPRNWSRRSWQLARGHHQVRRWRGRERVPEHGFRLPRSSGYVQRISAALTSESTHAPFPSPQDAVTGTRMNDGALPFGRARFPLFGYTGAATGANGVKRSWRG
jgi:hypothetical protein